MVHNTTVKTGKGWNWLWAAEKSYGGEESDQRLRAGNKPPGGVVGPFGLPGESLQVLTGSAQYNGEDWKRVELALGS